MGPQTSPRHGAWCLWGWFSSVLTLYFVTHSLRAAGRLQGALRMLLAFNCLQKLGISSYRVAAERRAERAAPAGAPGDPSLCSAPTLHKPAGSGGPACSTQPETAQNWFHNPNTVLPFLNMFIKCLLSLPLL